MGANQIELPVRFPCSDVAAMIKLAIDGVHVGIEDQRAGVNGASVFRDLRTSRNGKGECQSATEQQNYLEG